MLLNPWDLTSSACLIERLPLLYKGLQSPSCSPDLHNTCKARTFTFTGAARDLDSSEAPVLIIQTLDQSDSLQTDKSIRVFLPRLAFHHVSCSLVFSRRHLLTWVTNSYFFTFLFITLSEMLCLVRKGKTGLRVMLLPTTTIFSGYNAPCDGCTRDPALHRFAFSSPLRSSCHSFCLQQGKDPIRDGFTVELGSFAERLQFWHGIGVAGRIVETEVLYRWRVCKSACVGVPNTWLMAQSLWYKGVQLDWGLNGARGHHLHIRLSRRVMFRTVSWQIRLYGPWPWREHVVGPG